jgi:hypothetical protein
LIHVVPSKNRTWIEGRIEEDAPNYESLSEMETEEDVEGAKDEGSQEEQEEEDLLARPARTVFAFFPFFVFCCLFSLGM